MKKRVLIILCFVLATLFFCVGCGKGNQRIIDKTAITPPENRTSIYALIIDPEVYDGQTVTVRGAFYLDGDGAAL